MKRKWGFSQTCILDQQLLAPPSNGPFFCNTTIKSSYFSFLCPCSLGHGSSPNIPVRVMVKPVDFGRIYFPVYLEVSRDSSGLVILFILTSITGRKVQLCSTTLSGIPLRMIIDNELKNIMALECEQSWFEPCHHWHLTRSKVRHLAATLFPINLEVVCNKLRKITKKEEHVISEMLAAPILMWQSPPTLLLSPLPLPYWL